MGSAARLEAGPGQQCDTYHEQILLREGGQVDAPKRDLGRLPVNVQAGQCMLSVSMGSWGGAHRYNLLAVAGLPSVSPTSAFWASVPSSTLTPGGSIVCQLGKCRECGKEATQHQGSQSHRLHTERRRKKEKKTSTLIPLPNTDKLVMKITPSTTRLCPVLQAPVCHHHHQGFIAK